MVIDDLDERPWTTNDKQTETRDTAQSIVNSIFSFALRFAKKMHKMSNNKQQNEIYFFVHDLQPAKPLAERVREEKRN